MSATTTVSTKRSPILGWAIWLFAVAFCLAAINELDRSLFWIEICVLLCIAFILFFLTVPTRRRSLAFIVALVFASALWIGTVIDMILTSINFPENGIAQKLGLTTGSMAPVSAVLGLLVALLLAGVTVWLASVIAAEYILLFSPGSGQSRWQTELNLLGATLGRDARYGIVENGEFKPTHPRSATEMPMAPATISISPGHAVVFEQRGTISQIAGPGIARIRPQEQYKHIVRLGPRSITFTCEGALTKDGIPLVVMGTLVGSIEPETALLARRNTEAFAPYSRFRRYFDQPLALYPGESAPETSETTRAAPSLEPPSDGTTEPSPSSSGESTSSPKTSGKAPDKPGAAEDEGATHQKTSGRKTADWLAQRFDRLLNYIRKSVSRPSTSGNAAENIETVKGEVATYQKESIYRAAYKPPAPRLDQALEDMARYAIRYELAKWPFDHIINGSGSDATKGSPSDATEPSSTHLIAENVLREIRVQTACWGMELDQFPR